MKFFWRREEERHRQIKYQRILYNSFQPDLYRIVYRMVKDHYLSEDIIQETFIKLFKNIHRMKDEKHIRKWLTVTATNMAIDFLRDKKRKNELLAENHYLDFKSTYPLKKSPVEKAVEDKITIRSIEKEISKLPPKYFQVLVLKYECDMKINEIAEDLQISENTVKTRLFRAKKLLRKNLKESDDLNLKEVGI